MTFEFGYATVDDVRRVMQETTGDFEAGAFGEDQNRIAVDSIVGLTQWINETAKRHWYVPAGVTEDTQGVISDSPIQRDDEHDLRTNAAYVDGSDEYDHRLRENSDALQESKPRRFRHKRRIEIKDRLRIASGDPSDASIPTYTRITFDRKDIQSLNSLFVVTDDGDFTDWVESADFDGGVGNQFRGQDYWVRVNNRGETVLNLNVHSMDDELPSLSNAVYVDFEYGHEGLPKTVRRGVAHLAASDLVVDDDFMAGLPDSGQLTNVETKADRWERRGKELLAPYFDADVPGVEQPAFEA